MIKKKICMIGAFAVGKTSLVQQYVNSIFSDKYHTTIGVKIDQKMISLEGKDVNMLVWDIHGEDEYQKIKPGYLVGASGYFLVIDGTRKNTIDVAKDLSMMVKSTLGDIPFIVLINKSDLRDQWEITENDIKDLKTEGWKIILTSARENDKVDEAFVQLCSHML